MKNGQVLTAKKKVVLGRYVVADPKVRGGQLTFRGTRILVADVLEQVCKGMAFDAIRESHGKAIRLAAIQEAMQLAREALLTYWLPADAAASREDDPEWWDDDGPSWWQRFRTTRKLVFGRYVVADPEICHGKLTFRGHRIFVADALDDVARGTPWMWIEREWGGSVKRAAIAAATRLACEALLRHWPQLEIQDAQPDARS